MRAVSNTIGELPRTRNEWQAGSNACLPVPGAWISQCNSRGQYAINLTLSMIQLFNLFPAIAQSNDAVIYWLISVLIGISTEVS